MELVYLHSLSILFYSVLLLSIGIRRLRVDSSLILAIVLTLFWLLQAASNNLYKDSYYINYYSVILSLFGWMLFLQVTYFRIPKPNHVNWISVYAVNVLLILIFLFQFHIDSISQSLYFDQQTLYFAAFIMAIAMLFYLENIIRCLRAEHRYAYKHLLFILLAMALINLIHFYQFLVNDQIEALVHYLSISIHLLIPVFIFVSVHRLSPRKTDIFNAADIGHFQYMLIIIGAGLIISGIVSMLDFYFSRVRSEFYQAILYIALLSITGMLVLSKFFRSEFALYLKSYFTGDSNDYKKEWDQVSHITRDVKDIYKNMMVYYQERLSAPEAAFYVRRHGHQLKRVCSTHPYPENFSEQRPFLQESYHLGANVFLQTSSTNDPVYNVYIVLAIENDMLAVCWLKLNTPPANINSASLALCQTVSTEFAIRLREIEHQQTIKRQEKLSGFNKVVTFLAHDLKNIAAQQKLALANFSKYREDPEFLEDFNETIEHSTRRLENLISQFRAQSLNSSNETVTVKSLEKWLEQKTRVSGWKVNFHFECGEDLQLEIPADVMLIIENLLKNALEASSEDQSIDLLVKINDGFELRIIDHGQGISQDFIDNGLFEPFSSQKENGLGIGLFHVKSIVENLGGDIEVLSEIGQGTTFSVSIPL